MAKVDPQPSPPAGEEKPAAAKPSAKTVTNPFAMPRKEQQRRDVAYQHQRAAVQQRAMVKQRKGR
jgi:hypothetical protein